MQLKTILNRVQKFNSFVYGAVRWVDGASVPTLEIELQPRVNSRPICSGCARKRPGCDRLPVRRFEFIPLWGHKVFLVYAPRRVQCGACGVRVERMPWVEGKPQLREAYSWFLAGWAKRLSWQEVAEAFRTTWDHVFCSVERAVAWGRAHQDLSGVQAIGVDEIAWQRGHRCLTLVYQIDRHCKRLLWVGEQRTVKTVLRFFRWFGKTRSQALGFVCRDMWKPYVKVLAKKAGSALHILDRFHIMAHLNKAIDAVRAQETKELKAKGYEPLLTTTRWLLLKRPENLTDKQGSKLSELVQYNLKSIRSYLLKEECQLFWAYRLALLGRTISEYLVHQNPALEDCPHEASGQDATAAPAPVTKLVPGQKTVFQWHRGGLQHQSETDYQKSVWISNVLCGGNRLVSCPGGITRSRNNP